uniref:Uncharacterized protein n=1 Tax=Parascaris equorum TaxID=6256 RepID=A0A914RVI3_PAREQ
MFAPVLIVLAATTATIHAESYIMVSTMVSTMGHQRTAHYETCLRAKAPSATPIENAKKCEFAYKMMKILKKVGYIHRNHYNVSKIEALQKAKCDGIMRKHPVKRDSSPDERQTRRSLKKDKKRGQAAQKSCFRDARKIKLQCSQLAKCCSVSKQ